MRQHRHLKIILFSSGVGVIVLLGLLMPFLSRSGVSFPLCGLQAVSAQGDPCLDREVTISAQQVQILQLQGTMNAQQIANLKLESTDTALRTTLMAIENSHPNQIIITVPVLITATPNPSLADNIRIVTATSSPEIASALMATQPQAASSVTPAPTAVNSQVEIIRVLHPGDINDEGVNIRNNGSVVDLTGWEIISSSGEIYTFPQQRLFTGSELTIYTRLGTDTPTAKFWGLDHAVWSSGSSVTLNDEYGKTMFVYRVP